MNARALLERAVSVLKGARTVAVVGASANPAKYGYELVAVLDELGLQVFPINPKRQEILGRPCSPSVKALPESPDVLVVALAPNVTEKVLSGLTSVPARVIWLPPGCFTEAAEVLARSKAREVLAGICPVMAARAMQQGSRA